VGIGFKHPNSYHKGGFFFTGHDSVKDERGAINDELFERHPAVEGQADCEYIYIRRRASPKNLLPAL
jgi:hypothetical protein